ncbi:hypothetical protein Poli38472_008870 [Pythium oligandrum]|uniref:TRAF-type domain-containing protein n=1 Tax=Pythium oligandrum TaxID=41045 RepID=A0A8K1FE35_PYTOL|nr:hypothetical protein Poli38472_008870 [Pythium oligandrum]|eukprot:TMW56222.1 hypothetical protein Poli38472_008870 [Pythium oligandrum]
MDSRLLQSPLRRSVRSKYLVSPADKKALPRKRLRPLDTSNVSTSSTTSAQLPSRTAVSTYEASLQRRDFAQALWLIENGDVPIDYETIGGETVLLAAISAKNEAIVRLILARHDAPSINCRNRHGYSPLMKAVAAAAPFAEASHALKGVHNNNHSPDDDDVYDNAMVSCILSYTPDLQQRDAAGHTAADWARRTENSGALALLHAQFEQQLAMHEDVSSHESQLRESETLLRRHEALASQLAVLLRQPLLQEDDLMRFLRNVPPDLTLEAVNAAYRSYQIIVKRLNRVADPCFHAVYLVNRETNDGWTPLTKAAACGFAEVFPLSLSLGGDLGLESVRLRHTPLTWASYCGHEGVVLYLLRRPELDVVQQTQEGKTALMHAIANGQTTIVRHLLHAMEIRSVEESRGRRGKSKDTFNSDEVIDRIVETVREDGDGESRLRREVLARTPRRRARPMSQSKTEEWHVVFDRWLTMPDRDGNDALALATLRRRAVEEENDSKMLDSTVKIHEMLQAAQQHAFDHAAYVYTHKERTQMTACRFTGCDFRAPRDLLPKHELHECPKRSIPCERCGESVVYEEQSVHNAFRCIARRVACGNQPFGCSAVLEVQEKAAHERNHCRKRRVPCRRECGRVDLMYDQRETHETSQCPLRLVECTMFCGAAPFPANTRRVHGRKHCIKRLLPCENGCGLNIPLDTMPFHVETLCELRLVPCKWAHNGCDVRIRGAFETRTQHEERDCAFRVVSCRHDACEMRDVLLSGFLDEHYVWQCLFELKVCPNGCGVELPEHEVDAHALYVCPQRLTNCRLDLCGKTLLLYDVEFAREPTERMLTSGSAIADTTDAHLVLRAMEQRHERLESFLIKLRDFPDGPSTEIPSILTVEFTRNNVLSWLEAQETKLLEEMNRIKQKQQTQALRVRVLSFDGEKQRHLAEFLDKEHDPGHSEWLSLKNCEYEVFQPDHNQAPSSLFQCGQMIAASLEQHEGSDCPLRLVPCPLSCGQLLSIHGLSMHLSKRCNLRNTACRLGCGRVLAFLSLNEHEETECPLRQVFCSSCHLSMPHRSLTVHLERDCEQVSRRCRLGCGQSLPRAEFASHEATSCPKRLVECSQCHASVWFCDLETHTKEECVLRVYGQCDAGCGQTLSFQELTRHALHECVMRPVSCPQCEETMPFRELVTHMTLNCSQRHVFCRRGCGQRLRDVDSSHHEDEECEHRLVLCDNHCGLTVARHLLAVHQTQQCPMRVVTCPHDCGDRLFAYQIEPHAIRCRQRRVACGTGAKGCARPMRLWFQQRRLVGCATHGETGLLWALKTLDEDLVTYFLQNIDSDDIEIEFKNGFTPLTMAAMLGSLAICKLLLRFGADVNHETSRGRTPLQEACMAREPEIVELLLSFRASVMHVNRHGQSVLPLAKSLAAAEVHPETRAARVLKLLKAQDTLEHEHRALLIAIGCSDYEFVARLLQYSNGMNTAVTSLEQLEHDTRVKQEQAEQARADVDESLKLLNESIADTEAKTMQTRRLREQVDDCKAQLARIDRVYDASLARSNALEAEMLSHIREITAQHVATLLNAHTPTDEALVVMKAICMLSGVMPRGRRNASEYTDLEWWKTAQALFMDRSLLQRLRGYRKQHVTPDVMAKMRRECLRHNMSKTSTSEAAEEAEEEAAPVSRLPSLTTLRGNLVGLLASWVKGVEIEYKATAERAILLDKQRKLAASIASHEEALRTAEFEMRVAQRSLPARHEEAESVQERRETAEKALIAAQQRVRAYQLVQHTALNGHTALTFASAIGNEAMAHMLLTHGASAGFSPEEREVSAAHIQLMFRDFIYRTKQRKRLEETHKTKTDEAVDALVRNVAQAFLLTHYLRKRHFLLQTRRVALHEAIYNGFPQIAEILMSQGATLLQKTHVFPIRMVPGSTSRVQAVDKQAVLTLRRRGGWQLVPLVTKRVESTTSDAPETIDPEQVEAIQAPMTIEETLNHAVYRFEAKTFRRDEGGWRHDFTFYSDTKAFVEAAMATLHETQATQKREIFARKNVAKKTKEREALHRALDQAICSRDFVAMAKLLDDGAFADYETKQGTTPLSAACVEERYVRNADGHEVLAVAFLLDRPNNHPFVNFDSSSGRTALVVAAFYGSIHCAQAMIERGASINQQSRKQGTTALMVAAGNGQQAFVEYLLRFPETDVMLTDVNGETAFDHAKHNGFVDIEHVLGAAMGGQRGRVFSSLSAAYGVCKWGCGFMTALEDHVVQQSTITKVVYPLQDHENRECPRRVIACPLGCGISTLWADALKDHLRQECPLRPVPCPQVKCGREVVWNRLTLHSTEECEYRTVLCECGESMTHQKHVLHAQNQCVQRLVPCPAQCRDAENQVSLVRQCELKEHQRSVCPLRRVRCRNGCVANELLFKDREHHETQLCVLRRVSCQWGCEETVLANAQLHHETEECLRRQLACPSKCGAIVVFADLDEHVSTTCPRRLTLCALKCGRKVPLHTMEHHVNAECRRRLVQCALCGEQLQEIDLTTHQTSSCAQRISVCGLCGQSNVPYAHLPRHRSDECRMRQVTCRFNCYIKSLLAHAKDHHEHFECSYRPIYCPLGCGETIIAHNAKRHERECIMRFLTCPGGCGTELRAKDLRGHEPFCPSGALQRSRKS